MKNKKNIIIAILLLIIVAMLGFLTFKVYNTQKEITEVTEVTNVGKLIQSDMVYWNIMLSGTIKSVSDSEILVARFNEKGEMISEISVPIREDIPFYSLTYSPEKPKETEMAEIVSTFINEHGDEDYVVRRKIDFNDIQQGQAVYVKIEFLNYKEWAPVRIEVSEELADIYRHYVI